MKKKAKTIGADSVVEDRIALWLYARGVIGLIRLAFELVYSDVEKLSVKIKKEMRL